MPEGESRPEIPKSTPEQTERKPEKEVTPSFEEKIKGLVEPAEEGKEAVITNEALQRLAELVSQSRNQTPERLEEFLKKGDDWFADGQVPKKEWAILGGLINEKLTEAQAAQPKQTVPPPEVKIDLGPLTGKFEQFLKLSQRQTQDLADSLRRLSPGEEQERWADVEYKQEFYTRFTPTLEPRFYTELRDIKERELFDARWQLARAAYFKKAYSAFPEKQFENQDLQLLRMEQMERLYNMRGVHEALEWYACEIVYGRTKIKVPREKEPITILECKDEVEFEKFRDFLRRQVLKEVTIKDEKGKEEKVELTDLERKEADAVAWNWIWCSNLVESVDSRYSYGKERHGSLPGIMVSDDVRLTFHPQEKYEDKCRGGVEWGAFGKWGITQIKRIMGEFGIKEEERGKKIDFKPASSPGEFWGVERIGKKVVVKTPECYPTTSMKSFWEETTVDDEKFQTELNRKPNLLDYLLCEREIPWKQVSSDPWIGYLPIKLKLAVGLFEYFKPGKPLEFPLEEEKVRAWTAPLLDSFRRLRLEDLPEKEYHNLKAWAVWAGRGGVDKPHEPSAKPPFNRFWRTSLEALMRKYQVGYLKRGVFGSFTGEPLLIQ